MNFCRFLCFVLRWGLVCNDVMLLAVFLFLQKFCTKITRTLKLLAIVEFECFDYIQRVDRNLEPILITKSLKDFVLKKTSNQLTKLTNCHL